jgi:hypothetical protein
MDAKVYKYWLGPESKKAYILLTVDTAPTTSSNKKISVVIARIAGLVLALLFSDINKLGVWIKIITQLIE